MVMDVLNAFIQTNMPPKKDGKERVTTKITGVLADMLVKLDIETYRKHVVFENVNKVIYVVLLREDCGMLVSVLLFYKKFSGYLENIGFRLNTYDQCVTKQDKCWQATNSDIPCGRRQAESCES